MHPVLFDVCLVNCILSSAVSLLGLIAVQPGLYLGLSRAVCGVMFKGDHSLTPEYLTEFCDYVTVDFEAEARRSRPRLKFWPRGHSGLGFNSTVILMHSMLQWSVSVFEDISTPTETEIIFDLLPPGLLHCANPN